MKPFVVTIDGPSGAGKTTISRTLAHRLGYIYVDTGALYRTVAFEAIAEGISADDDVGLEKLCGMLHLEFVPGETGPRLFSNGADMTDRIRTPEISMFASAVSARAVVRRYLLELQREMGRGEGTVFEGRDMGTVVFPDAAVKFYLDASHKTRARRRYEEMGSGAQSLEAVERDMKRRDEKDSNRAFAPLKPAEDAIRIDSTDLSPEEVVERMLFHVKQRFNGSA